MHNKIIHTADWQNNFKPYVVMTVEENKYYKYIVLVLHAVLEMEPKLFKFCKFSLLDPEIPFQESSPENATT